MSLEKTAQDFLQDARRHFDAKDHAAALQIAEDGLAQSPAHAGLCDLKMTTLRAIEGPEAAIAFASTLPRELLTSWLINRMVVLLIEAERLQEANDLLLEASAETRARQPYQMARIRLTEIMDGPEAALSHAQAFCRDHPDRPELFARAAGLLEELDRHNEAIDCLEPLMTPDAPWPHRKQFARVCQKAGYLIRAISVLEDAERHLQNPPPGLFYDLARALEEKGRSEEALAVLERGLQRHSNNPNQCWMKARILRDTGRADEALDFVFSLAPEALDEQLQNMVCSLLIEIERHGEAEDFIASLPTDAQCRPAILLARLRIFHAQLGPSEALEFAERSIGFRTSVPFLALEMSRLLQLVGRDHEAITLLTPFVIGATPAQVVVRLARLYLSTGRPGEALRLLAPSVDAKETNAAMQSLVVQAYEEDGQQANAFAAVEKGLQRFRDDPTLLAQYWSLMVDIRGREAAIQSCYKAQSDWPRSVQVQIKALQFLSRMGDEDGCKTAFEGIEHADPDHQQGVLARVNHLMSQKDAAGARAILERLRNRTGRTRLIDLRLSGVYFWLGLLDDAIELLTRLTADHANDVEAAIQLANYRRHVGDFDGARAALDSIRLDQIGPRIQRLCILAEIALDTAEIEDALSLMNEAVKLAPDHINPWQLKARAELMSGDVRASWESHRNWVKLRWTKDESGHVSNKVGRSLHGQVLNEFRLLGDEPALLLSRPGQDQLLAAQRIKECLRETPLSTPLALSLMTSLRRCGAIAETPERLATQLPHEDRIPRTLFQFWDTPEPPHQVTALMEENRLANPGYSYQRFDVLTAQQFLREKEETAALRAFRLAPHSAAKADIFRLVLLWHEGGVFMDADDRCTAPLDGLIDHRMRFVGYQEPQMSIGNNFLAVQPREPIIRAALEDAITAFNGPTGESIWLATGPGAITRAVATAGTDEAGMPLPGVHIIPMYTMRSAISPHIHLSYKSTASGWQKEFRRPVDTPTMRFMSRKGTA